jgi:hypothetical protein
MLSSCWCHHSGHCSAHCYICLAHSQQAYLLRPTPHPSPASAHHQFTY